jgi:hypothetical protein
MGFLRLFLIAIAAVWQTASVAAQGPVPVGTVQCVVIEVFVSNDQAESEQAWAAAMQVAESRTGIRVVKRPVDENDKARERLAMIAKYYKFDTSSTPVIYGCGRVIQSGTGEQDFERQLRTNLKIEVFTRVGCSRCDAAKRFLPGLSQKYPGFEIVYRDISTDAVALGELNQLVRRFNKAATSTPVFHFCNEMIIGFDRAETSGARLEKVLDRWSTACPTAIAPPNQDSQSSETRQDPACEVAASAPF